MDMFAQTLNYKFIMIKQHLEQLEQLVQVTQKVTESGIHHSLHSRAMSLYASPELINEENINKIKKEVAEAIRLEVTKLVDYAQSLKPDKPCPRGGAINNILCYLTMIGEGQTDELLEDLHTILHTREQIEFLERNPDHAGSHQFLVEETRRKVEAVLEEPVPDTLKTGEVFVNKPQANKE
jgi:hypothetical protein